MKIMYALLIGIVVFSFAGAVQAQGEDPYAGSYSCSGAPQEGCGECTDVEIYPPSGVVITKVSGDTYQFCPQYNNDSLGIRGDQDCVTAEIQNNVAHWSGTTSSEGITFTGEVTMTFEGSTMNAEESGQVSGECSCTLALSAICTR